MADLAELKRKWKVFSEKQARKMLVESFQKKNHLRLRFYTALLDYIQSTDSQNTNTFFSWYLERIDKRDGKTAHIIRLIQKVTKKKSDGKFRSFLGHCVADNGKGRDFATIIKPWLPLDEYQLLSANKSSDYSDVLGALIEIVKDKVDSGKLVTSAISSLAPTAIVIGIVHAVLAAVLYPSFITSSVIEGVPPSDREMTTLETRYMSYLTLIDNPILIASAFVVFFSVIYWSVGNWSKRGLFIREQYFDFLPPYSLSKINNQYQISLLIYHYMHAGVKWINALQAIQKISTPYVKQVVDQVIQRSVKRKPGEALNIFFMGETGDMIEDRAAKKELTSALEKILPTLREKKNEAFQNTVDLTAKVIFKPIAWGSAVYFLAPVLMHIFSMMQAAQNV
jgi:intein/homing endonuclease